MTLWFRVDVDFVLGPEFATVPPKLQALWLTLHALAARQGGPIRGLDRLNQATARRVAGVDPRSIQQLAELDLVCWVEDRSNAGRMQLAVRGFDERAVALSKLRSQLGRKGAESRWGGDGKAIGNTNAVANGKPMAEPMANGEWQNATSHLHHIYIKDPDPNLHETGGAGKSPPATGSGSSPPVPAPTAPPGMPEYAPLPDEPPPDIGARDQRRREPPRQQERTGFAIPGSTPGLPSICSRCQQPASLLIWQGRERLCDACRTPPAAARAAPDELRAWASALKPRKPEGEP